MKCTKIMSSSYNNVASYKSNVNFRNRNNVDFSKSYGSSGSYGSGMRSISYGFNQYNQPLEETEVYINTSGPGSNFSRTFSYYDDGKLKSITQSTPAGITAPSVTRVFQHDKSVYYPPKLNKEAQAIFHTNEGINGKTMEMNYYYIDGMLYDFIKKKKEKGQEFPNRIYAYSLRHPKSIDLFCKEGFKYAHIVGNVIHLW